MKDVVHWPLHRNKFGHIMPKKTKPLFGSQMVQVALVSSQETIHRHHFMSLLEQAIG
jgi:acyl-CoA thioesterase